MSKPRQDVLRRTRGLYEAMARFDAAAAREFEVHPSDVRAIDVLGHGPLTAGQLGDRLGLTSGSVTALVGRLLRDGWVDRRIDENDRRQVFVTLDASARERAGATFSRLGRIIRSELREFDDVEVDTGVRLLEALARAFDAAASPSRRSS